MAHYRILITDGYGYTISRTDSDCSGDREACDLAAKLLRQGVQAEVWNVAESVRLRSAPDTLRQACSLPAD